MTWKSTLTIRSFWVRSLLEFLLHYRIERTENDALSSWLHHTLCHHRCLLRWYLLDCSQVSSTTSSPNGLICSLIVCSTLSITVG